MSKKDYYKIMGVSKTASEKDIKTAYRRLARKYHPDISKEADAEERFKEMGEAYEVLKDPAKRKEYDLYLKAAENPHQNPFQYRDEAPNSRQNNPYFDSDFFESIFGHARYQQAPIKGQDYHGKIEISLEDAFHGAQRQLNIDNQMLNVKIPRGIQSGQQIRLRGQGGSAIQGGEKGDLYLTVEFLKHPLFDVMDKDIYLTLPITPWEAALGANINVPTLGGKIELKIPSNSQGGQKLRLKDRGLPGKPPGNQYILLKIVTPAATTPQAKALYQEMAANLPFNPRATMDATS
jgi:curved DNA-binding protein